MKNSQISICDSPNPQWDHFKSRNSLVLCSRIFFTGRENKTNTGRFTGFRSSFTNLNTLFFLSAPLVSSFISSKRFSNDRDFTLHFDHTDLTEGCLCLPQLDSPKIPIGPKIRTLSAVTCDDHVSRNKSRFKKKKSNSIQIYDLSLRLSLKLVCK